MSDHLCQSSSSSFEEYSQYYDFIYRDKDYDAETQWLYEKLLGFSKPGKQLRHLDLGAGTGKHAFRLAERGVLVTGVERSSQMISRARRHENLKMLEGGLLEFTSEILFSSCSAMFHVLSYMNDFEDFGRAVANVSALLEDGGVFIFDVWHTPAVQMLGVELRVKRVSNEEMEIIRIAEPNEDVQNKKVTVEYTLFVNEKETNMYKKLSETHNLRHFDEEDIRLALDKAGMQLVGAFESFTERPLSANTWSACYVAVKDGDSRSQQFSNHQG